ncbi:MAG TPA: trehalase family glycosidase [bacterium]|nr:trehalase family glycosidase [bacterium]
MRKFSRLILLLSALAAALMVPAPAGAAPVAPKKGVASPSPSLSLSGDAARAKYWDKGFEAVYKTLLLNLNMPNDYFQTRYAYPSPTFRSAYLWDSAFISQVWKPWDVKAAEEVDQTLTDHAVDGRLPHFANKHSKSDYTQPPVMAWSMWEDYLWSNDQEWLARVYPALKNYNRWYYANRRLANGLFYWLHSYESGIDNSPRFTSRDEKIKKDMTKIAAIDVNSFLVRQNETLAKMAKELGKQDDAAEFEAKARELRGLINSLLWDESTGYYYDRDVVTDQLVKLRTIASLFPLFAGVPDEKRAAIVRGHVIAPAEFNTLVPLPSTAHNDPTFEKDCWRGPIWINTAYMVIVGMERYGFLDDAAVLSFKLTDGIYKTHQKTGQYVEFYDPDRFDFRELSRKKGNLFKLLQNGNKPKPQFVGWTGLINTLVIEHLAGFRKDHGVRTLTPNFPAQAQGLTLRLDLPGEGLTIEIEVLPEGRTRGKLIKQGGVKEFSADKHETIQVD